MGSGSILPFDGRSFTTSQSRAKVKQSQTSAASEASQSRFGRTTSAPTYQPPGPDSAAVLAAVDRVLKAFLGPVGIPSEGATLTALRAIAQIDVRPLPDAAERRSDDAAAETVRRPASQLLGLDGAAPRSGDSPRPKRIPSQQRLNVVIDKLSDAAYTIVTQPTVVITRQILEEYVRLQARLGKPQSLPQILALYANKPRPEMAAGSIRYVERNPSKIDSAVDPAVAGAALDAAIEAKDLEAAIGIVENTYAAKAFLRAKLLRKALLPGFAVAATPVALYYAATQLAQVQYALEPKIATGMALVGALSYVGFTASIGLVAHFTANDQMKRVTWAVGTPLRHRWLHEEERAALDKIACSFGFSEEHRYGEEEGEEFSFLREYILSRSMILDAVELMPGMN
ncbi:97617f25-a3bb-4cf2-ae00-9b8f5935dfaa [Thermothielavioides terrestris]|uniref:97617f25-a3bb-4cf2-ae00-9b8f5935dfaa n=1 Tax=Thermothielavioides terrestris TaxID=2587410 RepID=A0A3S4AN63_9PEZI|nr:97617f25-a3bb-4cf2-ae00-9b8f5935dfaa [Thermothielavioides terrestris]